ncbi:MAG TPA: type II toxin-antitoxin system VapC family toxin [Geminicoccaceae bacterium]
MRVLLDTHAFLWWLSGSVSLSEGARSAIVHERTLTFVSAASAWEIATKHRLGRLPGAAAIVGDIEHAVLQEGFVPVPVSILHGQRAGSLPEHHKDPFDRMLIAQALIEDCQLISNDTIFDRYGVQRLW